MQELHVMICYRKWSNVLDMWNQAFLCLTISSQICEPDKSLQSTRLAFSIIQLWVNLPIHLYKLMLYFLQAVDRVIGLLSVSPVSRYL